MEKYRPKVEVPVAEYLISLYGVAALAVLELTREDPKWKAPIFEGRPAILAQVVFAVRHETAQRLVDFYLRRTFLGLELAPDHKGVDLVAGNGLAKVKLPPDARSGLLTQGAILKVTADGSVTSPVVRGVFVNERILGQHIDPPPPNIPAIEPDIRGAVSIRDQLEKQRDSKYCASCHARIDPAGFALEEAEANAYRLPPLPAQ